MGPLALPRLRRRRRPPHLPSFSSDPEICRSKQLIASNTRVDQKGSVVSYFLNDEAADGWVCRNVTRFPPPVGQHQRLPDVFTATSRMNQQARYMYTLVSLLMDRVGVHDWLDKRCV